jgi:hypothetical protein
LLDVHNPSDEVVPVGIAVGEIRTSVRLSPLTACQHAVDLVTDYIEQIRTTVRLVGQIEPEDLTTEVGADLASLHRA